MPADSDRADAHILDLCSAFERWLDDPPARQSARGRLAEALGDGTFRLLQQGLTRSSFSFRGGAPSPLTR
jgi:hypothetical protein